MKLLVTGGLGFIGSNFIRYILGKPGVEVVNVDAMKYGSNPENLKDVGSDERYSFVKGDISNYELMSKLVKDVDAVINFAAESHVDRSISNPYSFLQSNVVGVFTILEALRKNNVEVPIYGTGRNVRDWIYVLDHCEAIDVVMREGERGEVYNISSGEERTNLEVVKAILELMGKDEGLIEFVEDRPGHDLRYSLNSSKIREELGWRPKHGFKEGIEKTVKWYLENEWWWKPLADERVLHPTPWKLMW